MLENLEPAPRISLPAQHKPGVEFDGSTGTATTPGYESEPENFDEFLLDAGLDPNTIEVIPPIRTSRWQQQRDGELIWLTSYRFTFRRKQESADLMAFAKSVNAKKLPNLEKIKPEDKALVVMWSDLQVGKVDYRGNSETLIDRVSETLAKLMLEIKKVKPKRIIFADLGDTVENFYNANAAQQLYSNDLSIMEQVDLATGFAWQAISSIADIVPTVTYASVGSNHCQFRMNNKAIGKPTDDWGVFIGRQLARLAQESGRTNIRFVEPQPWDESLAVDVFDDGFHILGIVHGHQGTRPDAMATWWRQQAFGRQPVADANILIHGHWHHLRITELGSVTRGDTVASRFLIMAPTMDNGSNWFRTTTGEDSIPGLALFVLEKEKDFTGTVIKL